MADAGTVGNAYLNVVPKMQGNPEQMGSSFGKKFSGGWIGAALSGAVAVGNVMSDAAEKAVSVLGEQMSKAFWNYADFEQLAGGVTKIFEDADQSKIFADAQAAFKELNMSANDYLSSINQVGAAFAQTMGDQKGYDAARTGMLAISDYASGTGRDLEELNQKFALITRATSSYQSIADQFSGILPATSKDFLEQAQAAGYLSSEYQKLTDVPVAEYQEAVTQMLEKGVKDMGLAGNTAAESTETLSGSIAMMQSAWDNFLTALAEGGENLDLTQITTDLFDSIAAVADNVIPALQRIGDAIFIELPPILSEKIAEATAALPEIFGTAIETALGGSDQASRIVRNIVEPFTQLGDSFAQLATTVAPFTDNAGPVLMTILTGLVELASALVGAFALMLSGILDAADGVINAAQDMWDGAGSAIESLNTAVAEGWAGIKDSTSNAWNTIKAIPERAANAIKTAVSSAMGTIKSLASGANQAIGGLKSIPNTVQGIFNKVKSAMTKPIEDAKSLVKGALDKIKGFFPLNIGNVFSGLKLPHFSVSGGSFPWGVGGQGSMPSWSVSWYARGGFADSATLAGYGEKGTEFFWPGYEPYFDKYAQGIAKHLDGVKGGVTVNATINGVENAEDAVEQLTVEIKRLKAAGVF